MISCRNTGIKNIKTQVHGFSLHFAALQNNDRKDFESGLQKNFGLYALQSQVRKFWAVLIIFNKIYYEKPGTDG